MRTSSTAARPCSGARRTAALTWSAVRGAPGGDDYQKTWINPNNPDIILLVSRSGRRGLRESRRELEQLVHAADGRDVSRLDRQRVPVSRVRRPAGFGLGVRRQPVERRRDHVPRLASGEHPGVRRGGAGSEESRSRLRQRAQQRLALQPEDGTDDAGRSGSDEADAKGQTFTRNVRTMPIEWSPIDSRRAVLRARTRSGRRSTAATAGRASAAISTRQTWDVPANAGKYASYGDAGDRRDRSRRSRRRAKDVNVLWAGTDDGSHSGDDGRRHEVDERHAAARSSRGRASSTSRPATSTRSRPTPPRTRCASTTSIRTSGARTTAARRGRRSTTASRPARSANSIREDPRQKGLLYAATDTQVWVSFDDGDNWQSLRLDMPAISVRDLRSRTTARASARISWPARTGAASGFSTT